MFCGYSTGYGKTMPCVQLFRGSWLQGKLQSGLYTAGHRLSCGLKQTGPKPFRQVWVNFGVWLLKLWILILKTLIFNSQNFEFWFSKLWILILKTLIFDSQNFEFWFLKLWILIIKTLNFDYQNFEFWLDSRTGFCYSCALVVASDSNWGKGAAFALTFANG